MVNSFHHQAVKQLAPDFIGTAISEDEIIEAMEHINKSFAIGVQWHPLRGITNNDGRKAQ